MPKKVNNVIFENAMNIARYVYFWFFNTSYIIYSGVLFFLFWPKFEALLDGSIGIDLIFYIILFSIICLSLIVGLNDFRKDSKKLIEYLIVVELPLMSVAFVGLWITEMPLGGYFFLGTFFIASFFYLNKIVFKKKVNFWIEIIGTSVLFLCGLWVCLVSLAFLAPVFFELLYIVFNGELNLIPIFNFSFSYDFAWALIAFLSLILIPLLYCYFSFRPWKSIYDQNKGSDRNQLYLSTFIALIFIFITNLLVNKQNHNLVLSELNEALQNEDAESRILANKEYYREALLDIYLAQYSYLVGSDTKDYSNTFYLGGKGVPQEYKVLVQSFFNVLLHPFVYRGSETLASDKKMAETLFHHFFKQPIKDQERVLKLTDIRPSIQLEHDH